MSSSGEPAVSTSRQAGREHGFDSLSWPTRLLLGLFGVLTALGLLAMLGGADRTDQSFAWTISPPLTAAFCGAAYGAGAVLVLLTLRAGTWSQARWPLVTIFIFTVLTLLASLLHLHRLHLHEPDPLSSAAAWLWLVVYVAVPLGMTVVIALEERRHRRTSRLGSGAGSGGPQGVDGSRVTSEVRQPGLFTNGLVVQGILLTVTGVLLYLNSAPVFDVWPWALTPLIGMVTGAWLVSFGVGALVASRLDVRTLGPATAAYATFAALQLLAVALHPSDVRSGAALTVYLVVIAWIGATGAWGFWLARGRHGR